MHEVVYTLGDFEIVRTSKPTTAKIVNSEGEHLNKVTPYHYFQVRTKKKGYTLALCNYGYAEKNAIDKVVNAITPSINKTIEERRQRITSKFKHHKNAIAHVFEFANCEIVYIFDLSEKIQHSFFLNGRELLITRKGNTPYNKESVVSAVTNASYNENGRTLKSYNRYNKTIYDYKGIVLPELRRWLFNTIFDKTNKIVFKLVSLSYLHNKTFKFKIEINNVQSEKIYNINEILNNLEVIGVNKNLSLNELISLMNHQ